MVEYCVKKKLNEPGKAGFALFRFRGQRIHTHSVHFPNLKSDLILIFLYKHSQTKSLYRNWEIPKSRITA